MYKWYGNPTPVPELIMPGKWKKNQSEGMKAKVDLKGKVFVAPWDDTDESAALRAHEYLHIKLSPRRDEIHILAEKGQGFNAAVSGLEDARVNYLGRAEYGIDLTPIANFGHAHLAQLAKDGHLHPYAAACVYVSGLEYQDKKCDKFLINHIKTVQQQRIMAAEIADAEKPKRLEKLEHIKEDLDAIVEEVTSEPIFDSVLMGAQKILDLFKELGSSEGDCDQGGGSLGDGDGSAVEPTAANLISKEKHKIQMEGGAINPGHMSIVKPPLTWAPRRLHVSTGRKYKPDEYGMSFRYIDRYATDRACFAALKREGVGSVLFDISGSMGLSDAQVWSVIERSNHATLATYTGRGTEGELTIIATNGKIAAKPPRQMGGNIVDLPAMQWLLKQREPRFWISDGQVTGKHDRGSTNLRRLTFQLALRGRVHRYDSPEEFIEALEKGRLLKDSQYQHDRQRWWDKD